MAIVVTALGTNNLKTAQNNWTPFTNVTLSTGDTLILIHAPETANDIAETMPVTWNGQAMVEAVKVTNGNSVRIVIYHYYSTSGGTGDVYINFRPAGESVPVANAATLYKASGLATIPLDKTSSATGAGTDASTGATALLSQNDELVIGATGVEDEIDDAHGTWTTGAGYASGNEQFDATNGGGDASNIQVHSVVKIVADGTSQAYQGVDAGHDSTDWAAAIATYKATSEAGGPTPNAYNKIFYTSEPPTPNAWNQVKQEAGTGWKKLLYI